MWSMHEILSRSGPTTDSNSLWTVQRRSNFDDDGARPVSYLQLVSPVLVWLKALDCTH